MLLERHTVWTRFGNLSAFADADRSRITRVEKHASLPTSARNIRKHAINGAYPDTLMNHADVDPKRTRECYPREHDRRHATNHRTFTDNYVLIRRNWTTRSVIRPSLVHSRSPVYIARKKKDCPRDGRCESGIFLATRIDIDHTRVVTRVVTDPVLDEARSMSSSCSNLHPSRDTWITRAVSTSGP